jgi:hypothetical protein
MDPAIDVLVAGFVPQHGPLLTIVHPTESHREFTRRRGGYQASELCAARLQREIVIMPVLPPFALTLCTPIYLANL